jgi:hypothetical protein
VSTAAFAIVTAPDSAETVISFDVPENAFAVATTFVPNAVLIEASSAIEPPDKPHATVPVFVPVTVQNA